MQTKCDGHSYDHYNLLKPSQVILKVGLAICVFDILNASEGKIGQDGRGSLNVNGRIYHDLIYLLEC